MVEIRVMHESEIGRIADIDRTEHVTLGYRMREGKLETEEVSWRVSPWFEQGEGEHSLRKQIRDWRPLVDQGGTMLGAFDGERLVGVCIYRPHLTGSTAQLAVLHVSNGYRRRGIARHLTAEVERLARQDGSTSLYVSATPSGSAVGFYRSQGFDLVDEPDPALYALEPEDIHLIKTL